MEKSTQEDYKVIAARAQQRVLDSIPSRWRLPSNVLSEHTGDAHSFVTKCGILTSRQLEITQLNASQVLKAIHAGEITAVEVTESFCARAAVAHQLVNCLMEFFPDEAISRAKELDEEFSKTGKVVGELHGMPMAVKDIVHLNGHVATLSFVAWADSPPSTYDASVVKVMRDAGAIFFGRTAMPQTGMALETVSNLWGRTLNPFNPAFGAGGSSGGDAALCALRGEPGSPLSSDIGGSIRAPAAFNGLYGMRPTADRIPRGGMCHPALGNTSIKSSVGPCCHSMEDLKLFVRLLLMRPTLRYEPSAPVLGFWNDRPEMSPRLRIGIMSTDGVVEPHPPIKRALRETVSKLRAAGHDVFEFPPPFDYWEAALTTWALYFQTGAKENNALLAAAGEPAIPQFAHNFEVFKTKELTVPELFQRNREQAAYKASFQKAWDEHMLDCIICPSAPLAGSPNDFPLWWGYTTLYNLLDYPSIIMPIRDFKISSVDDPKDMLYQPKDNPFDRRNWEIYDPELWKTQPVTIQIVGRPSRDEALIALSEGIDEIVNK